LSRVRLGSAETPENAVDLAEQDVFLVTAEL
jgi:hypothetical protein